MQIEIIRKKTGSTQTLHFDGQRFIEPKNGDAKATPLPPFPPGLRSERIFLREQARALSNRGWHNRIRGRRNDGRKVKTLRTHRTGRSIGL